MFSAKVGSFLEQKAPRERKRRLDMKNVPTRCRLRLIEHLLLVSLIGALMSPVLAIADVYKCRRGGVIAYQDRPCAKGTSLGKVVMDPQPAPGKTPASSVRPPTPLPNTPPAPPAPAPLPQADNYKCTRYDGTSYYSASLMPKRYYVLASALTPPRKELPANSHIWVTDQCVSAPLQEACDHYNTQMDALQRKARNASGIEKSQLDREVRRLRTISNSRCR